MQKSGKLQSLRKGISKKSPEILIALGIISMVSATVMAIRETPKAMKAIEELKEQSDDSESTETAEAEEKDISPVEIVKATWKFYLPSLIGTGLGLASILESHSIMKKRLAVFVTAYSGLDTAYNLYKKKAVDILGEKKEQEIKDAVAKEHVDSHPVMNNVFATGKGDTLCFDTYSGRPFRSDIEEIRRAINNINHQMMIEGYVSLNEVYYELGLEGVRYGDDVGWRADGDLIDFTYSSQLTKNDEPCLAITFEAEPLYDYSRSIF